MKPSSSILDKLEEAAKLREQEAFQESKLLLLNIESNHPQAKALVDLELSKVYFLLSEYKNAKEYLEKSNKSFPDNYLIVSMLCSIYEAESLPEKVQATLISFLSFVPSHESAKNRLNELKLLDSPEESSSQQLPFSVTLGQMYEKQGHFKRALEVYKSLDAKSSVSLERDIERVETLLRSNADENFNSDQSESSKLSEILNRILQRRRAHEF